MSSIELRINIGDSSYEVTKSLPTIRTYAKDLSTPAVITALDAAVRDIKAALRAGDPT